MCRLEENGSLWTITLADTIVSELNISTGAVSIETSDLALDNTVFNYKLTCISTESTVSTLSNEPDQDDEFEFSVTTLDICREADLNAPEVQ